ncbi:helix-turn-helix domain-containing protein [Nocardia sp. NPDC006630]|uniref:helix-turn-helix domain-containing protein n=1 Tax=Nocardia sp. NPDC006630 TaxID=3157181 RepID=UPI00339DFE86
MLHCPQPPRLGDTLRRLRENRRISRESLAFASGVSASYLSHLERGHRDNPGRAVLIALLKSLDRVDTLTDAERRHCLDLAGVGIDSVPTVVELRETITGDIRRTLALCEPRIACYFDIRLNVLACNEAFTKAFKGIAEEGNFLRWYLSNAVAKQIVADWNGMLTHIVGWLRGAAGSLRSDGDFAELLSGLATFTEFRDAWAAADPVYSDGPTRVHLHEASTGAKYAVDIQGFRMDHTRFPGWIWYLQTTPPQGLPA